MKAFLLRNWVLLRIFCHWERFFRLGDRRAVVNCGPGRGFPKISVFKASVWDDSLACAVRPKTSILQLVSSIYLSCNRSQILSLVHRSWRSLIFFGHLKSPCLASRHSEALGLRLIKRAVIMILSWQIWQLVSVSLLYACEAPVFWHCIWWVSIINIFLTRVVQSHAGRVSSFKVDLVLRPVRLLGLWCEGKARRCSFLRICFGEVFLEEVRHVVITRSCHVDIHRHILGWNRALLSVESAANRDWKSLFRISCTLAHGASRPFSLWHARHYIGLHLLDIWGSLQHGRFGPSLSLICTLDHPVLSLARPAIHGRIVAVTHSKRGYRNVRDQITMSLKSTYIESWKGFWLSCWSVGCSQLEGWYFDLSAGSRGKNYL